MCVGTMEGFSERGDWSYEVIEIWISAFEDEVDIVKEAIIDDSAKENHFGGPLSSVPLCTIVECTGLSRAS